MFSNHQRMWNLNYWARFILYKSLTQGVPIVHNNCMCWLLTYLQCESYGVWWTLKKIAYKKYCSCIVGTRLIPILFAIHSCGLIIYVPNNGQDPEAWLIQFTIFTYHSALLCQPTKYHHDFFNTLFLMPGPLLCLYGTRSIFPSTMLYYIL